MQFHLCAPCIIPMCFYSGVVWCVRHTRVVTVGCTGRRAGESQVGNRGGHNVERGVVCKLLPSARWHCQMGISIGLRHRDATDRHRVLCRPIRHTPQLATPLKVKSLTAIQLIIHPARNGEAHHTARFTAVYYRFFLAKKHIYISFI